MSKQSFVISYSSSIGAGKVTWRSPYNIELVKHFGKREHNLPANPSLSISLSEACTETSIEYEFIEALNSAGVNCLLEGNDDATFTKCISAFIENVVIDIPILNRLRMNISSKRTLPYLSGGYSLASVFSSLALCLCSIEEKINGSITGTMDFYRKASYLARFGSGTACRSVYGGYVVWGDSDDYRDFSNLYAHPFPFEVHPIFQQMEYNILMVSPENKKITDLTETTMVKTHAYSSGRFDEARNNLSTLIRTLQSGDIDAFIKIVENEALSLHAFLISSLEEGILLKPESNAIIEKIRLFRRETQIPVCFTLDIGPNIHLLFPSAYKDQIASLVKNDLLSFCEGKKVFSDCIGKGPEQL